MSCDRVIEVRGSSSSSEMENAFAEASIRVAAFMMTSIFCPSRDSFIWQFAVRLHPCSQRKCSVVSGGHC